MKIIKLNKKEIITNLFNLNRSLLNISFTNINNLQSNLGGTIFILFDSGISIYKCSFNNIKTKGKGSIIYSINKSNNKLLVIKIFISLFYDNSADLAGGLFFIKSSVNSYVKLNVSFSLFYLNRGNKGGFLFF